jgi:hypothetical protein
MSWQCLDAFNFSLGKCRAHLLGRRLGESKGLQRKDDLLQQGNQLYQPDSGLGLNRNFLGLFRSQIQTVSSIQVVIGIRYESYCKHSVNTSSHRSI